MMNTYSVNFAPLAEHWPQLFAYACQAEQYVYFDPNTSIVKLRCFVEVLVAELYQVLHLTTDNTGNLFDRLKAESFQELIDSAILAKLHAIRILGNKAAHGQTVTTQEALLLIREAYLIGQWLYKTYHQSSGHSAYPEFSAPTHTNTSFDNHQKSHAQLAHQLTEAKAELERLKASEQQARRQIIALNHAQDRSRQEAFKQASTQAASTFNLEQENTRQLITIHDAFSEYTLNDGQSDLVKKLEQFLTDRSCSVFLLKGYAGTGKTFITKGLTEYFQAIGRNFVLAAPTGKASKVIARKTGTAAYTLHKVIYSFKDIIEYREDNLDGSQTYKCYAQLAINEASADTVYIVDESSMISDVYQDSEFFRCGSGHLLRDFLKYVNLDHNDHNKKVIFMGDNAQLPPVGMSFSPALNSDYLFREHNIRSTSYELTEVVRQKTDSGVMANALKLRESLASNLFNQLAIDLNYPDVEKVEYQDLLAKYLDACEGKVNDKAIVIAASNGDVAAYNRRIREHFFPGYQEVIGGDKVMAVSNSNAYGFFISNGDFGFIRAVAPEPEVREVTLKRRHQVTGEVEKTEVCLHFRDVNIGFRNLDGTAVFFDAKILEDLLYSEEPGLSSDQSKALYVDFCIRCGLKPGTLEFREALHSDPYFNALRLKFGYAITAHKAQGSEWNHVFVKCKSHHNPLSAGYFRWFYTVITRTSDKLSLLDPPNFQIGSGIKSIQNFWLNAKTSVNESQTALISEHRPSQHPPASKAETNTLGIPEGAKFLINILNCVRQLISGHGIDIEDVVHNQYQEAYTFRSGDGFARINIAYSSRNRVTRIAIVQPSELASRLATLLEPLTREAFIVTPVEQPATFVFEQNFLNDFHVRLMTLSSSRGIAIRDVRSMQWCQRYTFSRSDEVAVYDVWYNSKSRFTSCGFISNMSSSGGLAQQVQQLLTEGMSA